MCWPQRKIPTNELGRATRLWLCHCQAIQIRVFHITWFTFWLCFFGWFATANLYGPISESLGLTDQDKALAGGCSVASTIIFRVLIGYLCDKIGARYSYSILLIISAFPVCGMALVQNNVEYIICSLFIGIVGGSFVITQYHTTRMFAGKTVGTANATSAGWGNFGGGCANFFMPLLLSTISTTYDIPETTAWRYCMLVPGLSYIALSAIYFIFTVDLPPKPSTSDDATTTVTTTVPDGTKTTNDIELTNIDTSDASSPVKSSAFKIGATDYRTWILFGVYAACFGIELTVLRFATGYFQLEFDLSPEMSGFIILCFSFCNLFARSLGGLIADIVSRFSSKSLRGRVYSLFIVLLFESIFLILFALGHIVNNLGYTITMMIMFSLFVQAAEGVTFAIVPFVQPNAIGPVAGIVGAGGNTGAVLIAWCIFYFVPTTVSYGTAWSI